MNAPVEILLVEDNPNDVKLTLNAFARHPVASTIHVVRDGEEALDFIFCRKQYARRSFKQVPKFILLDLTLPKVDGLEVLRLMKADRRTQAIPVVILTSSAAERDIVEGYQLGVTGYIVKPLDADETTRVLGMYWLLLNQPPVPPVAAPSH